jgi:alkanesulfonate monooxygenase SsuD/methylene tetrahydromethanopterin reductase-like flavin-dependent oxidoreductase (luciferase family)
MLDLAGELADGIILSRRATFSPKYTKYAVGRVMKKARDMGRDPSQIDSVGFFETVLSEDGDEAKQFAKKILATYTIPGTPQYVLDLENISEEDVEKVKANYLNGSHEAAIRNVTDYLVDKFALAGTPDQC